MEREWEREWKRRWGESRGGKGEVEVGNGCHCCCGRELGKKERDGMAILRERYTDGDGD